MLIKAKVVTGERYSLCATITSKGRVLEIEHDHNDDELYNMKWWWH